MFARRGLTFVEVLTVVTILLVLAAFLFPVYSRAKLQGTETSCTSRLRQIYMSLEMYGADNPGYRPVHGNVDLPNSALLRPHHALAPYLASREILYCPATPSCAKGKRSTTYRWVGKIEEPHPYAQTQNSQVDQLFEDPAKGYPAVYCLVHDEVYYYPSERGLAEDLNPPFVIRLLPSGAVKRGRYDLFRDHHIARICSE
ncbi:MAG: type II secretion system protein [Fimbriimonadaceae bacterium]